MKEEDYNRMYKRWLASKKLKELREEFELRKENMAEDLMSKEELIKTIESMMEYHLLTKDDKEASDWLINCTKEDMADALRTTLVHWLTYIKLYEIKEDYETCALIKKLIDCEIEEAKRFCNLYFDCTEEDMDYVTSLPQEIKEIIDYQFKKNIENARKK